MFTTLKEIGAALSAKFDQSWDWLDSAQLLTLKNKQILPSTHRDVRQIIKALDKKPVFALFGASQVGKSYLAHIILSGNQPKLMVDLGDKEVDFLTHINPVGGDAEATGVVTRFTIEPIKHASYPVTARLLGVEDICLVLCNALYNNFQGHSVATSAIGEHILSVQQKLPSLEGLPSLPEDAQFWTKDIRNSFIDQFPLLDDFNKDLDQFGLWGLLESNLDKLLNNPTELAEALSPLWKLHEGLTEIASLLFSALHDLKWATSCHLPGKSVLRGEYDGHAIVDVSTLKDHLGSDNIKITVKTENSQTAVNRAVMSALTKEIVLTVTQNDLPEDHYLRITDIMDFPGARSPVLTDDPTQSALPFLRGKVGHLFDQYSRDYEINNLLFCMADKQNEVTDLPRILESWIEKNIGETPEKRAAFIEQRNSNPLMVIFTWFNRQLIYDETNDIPGTLGKKWEKRFNTFFESEMVRDSTWADEWTPHQRFKNIFPLRDYSFPSIFDGYKEHHRETGLRSIQANEHFKTSEDFMESMKDSFVQHEGCIKFLENPAKTWESCASPNQDGSAPIVQAMEKASLSSGLEQNAKRVMYDSVSTLLEVMTLHHHGGNAAERQKQASELKTDLELFFNRSYARSKITLLLLQRAMCISPEDVNEWIKEQSFGEPSNSTNGQAVEEFLAIHSGIQSGMSPSEVINWFMNHYKCDSEQDAEEMAWTNFKVNLKTLFSSSSEASINPLIPKAIEHFGKNRLNYDVEQHKELVASGISEELLIKLLKEFKLGMESRNLVGRISKHLAGRPEILTFGEVVTKELSELIAHQWNELIFYANSSFYTSDELDNNKIRFTQHEKVSSKEEAYELMTSMFKQEKQETLQDVYFSPGLRATHDWMERIHNLIDINCGIPNYDLEANNILGRYIQELEQIKKAVST